MAGVHSKLVQNRLENDLIRIIPPSLSYEAQPLPYIYSSTLAIRPCLQSIRYSQSHRNLILRLLRLRTSPYPSLLTFMPANMQIVTMEDSKPRREEEKGKKEERESYSLNICLLTWCITVMALTRGHLMTGFPTIFGMVQYCNTVLQNS